MASLLTNERPSYASEHNSYKQQSYSVPAPIKQYVPLTCHGHSRPVTHLSFSSFVGANPEEYYMISACKGMSHSRRVRFSTNMNRWKSHAERWDYWRLVCTTFRIGQSNANFSGLEHSLVTRALYIKHVFHQTHRLLLQLQQTSPRT